MARGFDQRSSLVPRAGLHGCGEPAKKHNAVADVVQHWPRRNDYDMRMNRSELTPACFRMSYDARRRWIFVQSRLRLAQI